jgi:S-formylglutathione hydrolase
MFDYVACELPALVSAEFNVDDSRVSLAGHSMGGHGALTVALNNPARYRSVSAFAPIVAPSQVPWGQKALSGYLGADRSAWRNHDAVELVKHATEHLPVLIDQGDADNFLEEQLKTELLRNACQESGYDMTIRMQPGYDHSYFFIASFIEEHMNFHAQQLKR